MDISREFKESIRNSDGEAFYDAIEQYLTSNYNMNRSNPVFPVHLKKVLMLNDCDSALILSKFNKNTIYELEQFMKETFTSHLISRQETTGEYLGIFNNSQSNFQFLAGEKIMLRIIVKICKSVMGDVPTSDEAVIDDQVEVANQQELETTSEEDEDEEDINIEENDTE